VNDSVRRHLLRQAGIITRAQALAAGMTARQIEHLLSSREWLVAFTGVYRLHASVPLPETRLWAASLWLGPSLLLADEGAAWWWGVLPDPPSRWTFVGHSRRRSHGDVWIVDAFVDPQDRWRHRGLPVLSRPWCVLRAAASLERARAGSGIALIDRAKQTRALRQADLQQAFERHQGCWGSSTMRTLLARTGDGAHSELERVAVRALRDAGITGFEPNLTVRLSDGGAVEIDIAFVDRRIAIELEGFAFHSGATSFRRDIRRLNRLMRDGWTVRRFSWDDVVGDPQGFVDAVLELLAI
jgi:very-short-patch-repair endonuclease